MAATGAPLDVRAQAPLAPDGQSLTGDKCLIALIAITTACSAVGVDNFVSDH